MSDYTPTTVEVRDQFRDSPFASRDGVLVYDDDELLTMFDRWLAQHDAEIRADEREQAAQQIALLEAIEQRLIERIDMLTSEPSVIHELGCNPIPYERPCICAQIIRARLEERDRIMRRVQDHMLTAAHICCCPNVTRIIAGLPAARGEDTK